jgi:hypothetical protein
MAMFEALGAVALPVDHWVFAAIFTELERPLDAEASGARQPPMSGGHSA